MKLAQHDRIHSLVQKNRLASEDLDTPSQRLSYHNSCHPQSALFYEYTMHHHTHLEKVEKSDIYGCRFMLNAMRIFCIALYCDGQVLFSRISIYTVKDTHKHVYTMLEQT